MAAPRTIPPASSANSSWSDRARLLAFGAGVALAASQPLAAQDLQDTPRLEDLIPDSAVLDPESWAADGVPGEVQAEIAAEGDLPPDSELAEMPLVTVPWPDDSELPQLAPLEAQGDPVEFVHFDEAIPPLPMGSEERISRELVLVFPSDQALFPERDEFLTRFRGLSAVVQYADDDNLARLTAQARVDEDLLARMLRVYGYFDAQVVRSVGMVDEATQVALDRPAVRFDVLPGPRYTVGAVDLGNLAATGDQYPFLRRAYDINPGDPLSLDAIVAEQLDLDRALGESGFPFAAIEAPSLLVDHDRDEGDVTMPVEPGGRYTLRGVVSQQPDFLSSRHLTRIARWDDGDIYRRSDEMDLRRAILATGLVGAVELTPVVVQEPQGDQPGVLDLQADMTPAPLRTLAGSIGYGTGFGFRLEGSWEHRNLF
ncbi:MAG: outer membrane protein assembly factor, partial [Erythrobacter sp.]|nr:outer membrane protein assembly factor [Erythrobacter sp.]